MFKWNKKIKASIQQERALESWGREVYERSGGGGLRGESVSPLTEAGGPARGVAKASGRAERTRQRRSALFLRPRGEQNAVYHLTRRVSASEFRVGRRPLRTEAAVGAGVSALRFFVK